MCTTMVILICILKFSCKCNQERNSHRSLTLFCLRVLPVSSVLSTWTELVPKGLVIFPEVFMK